jgi:hypothetical protein
LQNNIYIPFSFKPIDKFVLAKVIKSKICGVWCGGDGQFDNGGMIGVIKASMRGSNGIGALARREGLNKVKEGRKAEWRDVAAVQVVERFWVGWWGFQREAGKSTDWG